MLTERQTVEHEADEEEHPRGTLVMMALLVLIIIVVWVWTFAELLERA